VIKLVHFARVAWRGLFLMGRPFFCDTDSRAA
jgi:hypothetical protein